MTRLFAFLAFTFLFTACGPTDSNEPETAPPVSAEPMPETGGYDAELAKELGADPYGMHQYVVAFLKAGPNRSQDSLEAAELQKAHLANITRMADEGKLVLAGPFLDDTDLKGIYVFNVATVEEAKALTESDPAIQAGRLVMELHPWYGSAALMQVNEVHTKLAEKSVFEE